MPASAQYQIRPVTAKRDSSGLSVSGGTIPQNPCFYNLCASLLFWPLLYLALRRKQRPHCLVLPLIPLGRFCPT